MNYEPAVDEILTPPPVPPVNMDQVPVPEPVETFVEAPAPVVPEVPEMPAPMPEPVVAPQPVVEPQPVAEPVIPEAQVIPEQPVAPQPVGQAYVAPAPDDVSAFKIPNVN